MALFNELGGGALGLNELLGRVLGMEKLAPAPTLAPELQPVLELFNLPDEFCFPAGVKCASLAQLVPAVAAEQGYIGVRNPTGSGVIARVELFVSEAVGLTYNVRLNSTDPNPTVDQGIIASDTRWGATAVTTCHEFLGSEAVPTGANMGTFEAPNKGIQVYPVIWILGPGSNVVLEHGTINTAFRAGFRLRERRARSEELA